MCFALQIQSPAPPGVTPSTRLEVAPEHCQMCSSPFTPQKKEKIQTTLKTQKRELVAHVIGKRQSLNH